MLKRWKLDGLSGNIMFPEGKVVYQTKGIVTEPVFKTENENRYILDNGKLLQVYFNPYNGYCYRQDGL